MSFDPSTAEPLAASPTFDPTSAAPSDDALLRAQIRRAMGTDALRASQASQLAFATGLPPDVALRNFDQLKRESSVAETARALEVDPLIGDYFRYAPLFAAKAQKDASALVDVHGTIKAFKGPEPTFENIARGLAASMPQGLEMARRGMQGQMRDFLQWAGLVQPDPVEDADLARKIAQSQSASDFTRPNIESRTGRAIYGGVESTLRTLPGLAASIATRSPTPMLATMGVQTQAEAYGKYRTRGGAPLESFLGATGEGAVEVATELLPTKFLTDSLGKRGVGEFLAGLIAREVPTEQVATFLQDAIDTSVANPDKTWPEFFAERPGAAYDTLVSTLTQSLITGGAVATLNKIAGTADQMGQAEASARQLQNVFAAASMVQMRAHAPQDFASAMQDLAQREGATESIFMDAEVLAQSGIDIAQSFPSAAAQMEDALALNTVVELPLGEVLAAIPGTPLEELFLQNARTSENAWSLAEASQIAEQGQQFIEQEAERVLQQAQDQSAWQTEVDTVRDTIKAQLDQAGRFTSDANEAYARLQSAFFSTMASRTGMTPTQLYDQFSLKVGAQAGQGAVLNESAPEPTLNDFIDSGVDGQALHIADDVNAPAILRDGLRAASDGYVYLWANGLDADSERVMREARQTRNPDLGWDEAGAIPDAYFSVDLAALQDRLEPDPYTDGGMRVKGDIPPEALRLWDGQRFVPATGNSGAFDPNAGRDVTQTPEFRAWFGDSKVVDAEGRPLVVYHGTIGKFDEFSTAMRGTNTGARGAEQGFFFAGSRADANFYSALANDKREQQGLPPEETNVFEAFLSAKNPLILGIDDEESSVTGELREQLIDADPEALQYAKENGYDSVIWPYGNANNSDYTVVVFDPTQIKSATGNSGAFDPNDPNVLNQSVSTRVPWAVRPEENHFDEQLVVNMDAARRNPALLEKFAERMREIPSLRTSTAATAEEQLEDYIEQIKSNLIWLHDQFTPDIRARAKLWYDGARVIVDRLEEQYEGRYSDVQLSAAIAALSPQMDWFLNVALATRAIEIWDTQQDTVWDDRMTEAAQRTAMISEENGNAVVLAAVTGKKLSELSSDLERAFWVAAYDLANNSRDYLLVTPEGDFGEIMRTDSGAPIKGSWANGFGPIAKSISVLRDGTMANISDALGAAHKVRNFYNNIYDPTSPDGSVTIDTHAVAAGLLLPLAGSSPFVQHNLGTGGSDSKTGIKGTYPVYAEAYRRAAAEVGLLPREMQSITWEAVRSLFKPTFKAAYNRSLKSTSNAEHPLTALWREYHDGARSLDETRQELLRLSDGIPDPAWARSDRAGLDGAGSPGNTGELYQNGGMGRTSGRGAGGNDAAQTANGELAQGPRGTFNPQTLLISLGESADLSTFLHESGHFFLEVMADLASQPDAPQQVVDDMNRALAWFGVPDLATWNAFTLDEKREHHEKWAEAFEQYLLEGKAPSTELQPLFRRFRSWLVNVYKSLSDFMRGRNLEVNDEIRQVFDRMLATDEQIAQAEEQAGLLPEFDATNEAIERLQERSLRALKWTLNARSKFLKQFTKEARELRKGVLAEVMGEFETKPEVIAARAIRKVRNKDGAERDAKIAAIADATGYPTVEEMTAAVTALGPVNEAVEAEVDRRMLERHGDMATQEALEAAANEAVHNEARARALAAELKSQNEAMNPRETTGRTDARGRPITVNALVEAARAFGADLAARRAVGKLKNAIYLHRAAEARAGRAWQTATQKGDTQAAVQAKKDQLLNNQAVRALLDAQAEVRAAIEFFRKVTKGNNEKLVKGGRDPDVVNAMRAILGVYGIAPRTGKGAMEYLELVQKNDPAMYAVIAPGVNTALANAKPFSELTVEEVRGLTDELKSLWHLAKRSRQMEIDGDLLDLEDLADQLYARMEDIGIPDVLPGEKGALTDAEIRKRNWLQQAPAILRRVEQWAEAKDGAFGGPFLRFIFQPVKIAADSYRADRLVYRRKFQALVDAIEPTMAKTLIAAPELDYTFGRGHNGIGMAEVLHAILHTGNDSNKRKLLLGREWATENPDGTLDTSRWDAFIARLITEGTLTKAHYDFAQGVWDLMEETKPLAQKTHRDVFGRYFAEVTANEVQTPFGTYRGGYVPAQADPLLVQDADQRELLETENAGMSYAFPATNKGFTKGRVEYNRPLKLDLRTLPQHIDKVLLFSHMEPAVRGVDRLLRRKKIAQALNKIDPAAINGMLKPWLNRSARQTVETPVSADAGLNRMLSQARARTGMALMLANVSNTLQQITGFATALLKVKGSHIRRAVAQYIADPQQLKNTVWSLSPYMADRASNEVAVLSDTLEAILLNPSVYESAERFTRRHAYFLQTGMDNQMSPIIWTGAYNQALVEGMGDRMARRFADGVIRQTQGSTLPEDVSRIETGTAFARAFTQFVGYFNMLANTNATAIQQIAQEQGLRKGAGKAFGVLMVGMMIPIWVAEVIAHAMRGGPEDEDDDGYLDDWLAAVFGFGTIRGILSGMPGIAQIGQSMVNRFNDNPADDRFSLSPTVSVLESAAAAPQSVYKAIVDEGSAQKAVRDMSALITLATGLPAMTLARPLGYAAGVAQGKIEPTGPVDAARGLVTGTASPESKNP
jgi:hypothetical protein